MRSQPANTAKRSSKVRLGPALTLIDVAGGRSSPAPKNICTSPSRAGLYRHARLRFLNVACFRLRYIRIGAVLPSPEVRR